MMPDNSPVTFYSGTADAWNTMYDDCTRAQKSIEFEQYILMDDEAGHRFLKLFIDKAKAGIKVSLMLDAIGSRTLISSPTVEKLRKAGGHVYFFNTIKWRNLFALSRCLPRNHNKTLLIDRTVGYIGSVCLHGGMRDWHDLHMRFTGPLIEDIATHFTALWQQEKIGKKIRAFYPIERRIPMRYVPSIPFHRKGRIYEILLKHINEARHSICLITPYFIPPWRLRRALRKAVRRGVSVKIMTSDKTDVKLADLLARANYATLLRSGLRIFHFKKTILHAKYAMVDGSWATLGSTNMDYLSLLYNHEANIMIEDQTVIQQLYEQFERDMRECIEIRREHYFHNTLCDKVIAFLGRSAWWIIEK